MQFLLNLHQRSKQNSYSIPTSVSSHPCNETSWLANNHANPSGLILPTHFNAGILSNAAISPFHLLPTSSKNADTPSASIRISPGLCPNCSLRSKLSVSQRPAIVDHAMTDPSCNMLDRRKVEISLPAFRLLQRLELNRKIEELG